MQITTTKLGVRLAGLTITVALLMAFSSAPNASADLVIGSTAVNRSSTDGAAQQVYMYGGGRFDQGMKVDTFTWYGDTFGGSRFMTPVLFEETGTNVFTVRGVGAGQVVSPSVSAQSFNFALAFGTDVTTNGNFTFGFMNALVDGSGTPVVASAGTVDFNGMEGGPGMGPGTTNQWAFTPSVGGLHLNLGTTYGYAGTAANFNFDSSFRTYSANLSSVPEPNAVALLGLGGFMLFAKRRRRNRKATS